MKKLILTLMCTVIAAATLTGCGKKNNTTTAEQGNVNSIQTEVVSITHSKGTSEVPIHPKKVVVFDLSVLDTMDALEIETELGLPSDLPSSMDQYADATVVGSMKEADLEAIYTFEPDVIFISGRLEGYYEELNKIAPTVYVELKAATYVEDAIESAKNIAKIFDKTEEAAAIIDELNATVAKAQELTAASDEEALILLTNEGNMSVYGSGSRYGFIHDVLGVKTADSAIEASTHGQEASYEYLAEVNPEIIYVIDRSSAVGGTIYAADTLNNDLVNGTTAAQNNKIVNLDSETWYLIGGGLNALQKMVNEVVTAYK